MNIPTAELVRTYVDTYIQTTVLTFNPGKDEKKVLRSVYLSKHEDEALASLAEAFQTTKGAVFRAAIAAGLGI